MLTSIIILTHNNLDYTKRCIESINTFTDAGTYEIIVVDNCSADGTVEWLNEQRYIKKILNKENLGFPKGCNQGIKIACGDNILLLNNDTIVTPNWLTNLEKCLYSLDMVGAVGPVTNNCSNNQTVPVNYTNMKELHEFAEAFNVRDPSKWEERPKLVGYCLLIKRTVVDDIGLLDERFSPGNYEDDDYCLRIRMAGYKIILCKDTFIHHYGSVSFKENLEKYLNIMKTNKKKFEEKWGLAK